MTTDKKKRNRGGVLLLLGAFFIVLPTLIEKYSPYEGMFLVATPKIEGYFDRKVIYMVRHNGYGAHGIILNGEEGEPFEGLPTFAGGPVESEDYLSRLMRYPDGRVSHEVILQKNKYEISPSRVADECENINICRLYRGYSGWGPLQLEFEKSKERWKIIEDPDLGDIFRVRDYREQGLDFWSDLMNKTTPENLKQKRPI